jgi:hypothetical protein
MKKHYTSANISDTSLLVSLVATGESEPRLSIRKGQVRVAGGVPRLARVGANLAGLYVCV